MRMFKNWSLAVRLTLIMTVMVVLAVVVVTAVSIRREELAFQEELQEQAEQVLDTLIAAQANALFLLDADSLLQVTESLGEHSVVTFGRVYGPDGRIVADAYDRSVIFNTEADPAGTRLLNSEGTVFDWQSEQLIAGKAVTAGRQTLGAISIGLSTASLYAEIEELRNEGITVAAIAAVVGAGLALVLSRSIAGPLRQMTVASERLTQGDYTSRISSSSGGELGLLADTFNKMSAQLQENVQKLEQRNADLSREIAERQKAEAELFASRQMLRLVMDTIPQSIVWKDQNSVMLGCNASFVKALNLPSQDWVIGKSDFDLVPAENAAQYQRDDRRIMGNDLAELNFEEPQTRPDGSTAWLQTSKVPLHDNDGKVAGVLAMFEDITSRKRAEEERERLIRELRIANEKALESSRLKSEFLATMSHELRTPLNAIIGFAGIMIEGMAGQIDDTARGMMNGIYESSQHLLNLINNVLDISKIEAGRLDVVYAKESLGEMIDRWRMQMDVLAKKKGLAFNIDIAPDVPDMLYTDSERLTQIMINLLGNAFKFTEEGGVNLRILREDSSLVYIVTDTGIGIAPHALHYIFDEFRQVDASAQRVYGGTGLGLAIVRKLCLAMDGNVNVTSKMGEGSTFTVTLPLQQPEQEKDAIR